jgi:hypothetical protein
MGEYGQRRMMVREQHSHFLFLDPKVSQLAPNERLLDAIVSRGGLRILGSLTISFNFMSAYTEQKDGEVFKPD